MDRRIIPAQAGNATPLALSPAFRETLDRHRALMKQTQMFRARPQVFERLLAERADIGGREIEELGEVHAQTSSYRRSVAGKAAHAAELASEQRASSSTAAELAADPEPDAQPDWRTPYKELRRDWNDLVARSEEPDLPLPLMDGYDALIRRVRTLADHPGLSEHARNVLDELLAYHRDEIVARETAEGYLVAAEHHVEAYKTLERLASERGLPVARLEAWPEWRDAAETLAVTGKAVLANDDRYGAYLDAMTIGKARARLTVEQLRSRLRENRTCTPKPKVRQPRREPTPKQERGFAHILDDPEELRELREKANRRDRRSRGLSM